MDDMLAGAIMGPLGEAGGPSPGVLAWAQQQQPSAIPAEVWRALGLPDSSTLAVRALNPKEPRTNPLRPLPLIGLPVPVQLKGLLIASPSALRPFYGLPHASSLVTTKSHG